MIVRLARWCRRSRQEASGVPSWVALAGPFALGRRRGFHGLDDGGAFHLGVSAWMTFWRITFPLILPGMGASFLLTFTASFDEFLFGFFLGGNKLTLPAYMWTRVRFPQALPTVLGLGALIFMVYVVLIGAAEWLRRMGGQQPKDIAR